MTINEVYMTLYARQVKRINKRFAEAITRGSVGGRQYNDFVSKYGER